MFETSNVASNSLISTKLFKHASLWNNDLFHGIYLMSYWLFWVEHEIF